MIIKERNILLIEDNLAEARLTAETIKENFPHVNLEMVFDGVAAIEYLLRADKHKNAVKPEIIILDINLPKKNGLEVLSEIKSNPFLKRIPVIILTTSKTEDDIVKAYDLHANCYITKPLDLERFIKVIRSIEDFWMNIVQLPIE